MLLFLHLFLLLRVHLICANKYLLTYILYGNRSIQSLRVWDFELMHAVQGHAATVSRVGLGDKACWSWRIFVKQIWNSNISRNKHNFLLSFSPTSELRIILLRHIDRRQVLSTAGWQLSPVDHTQHSALCTARWWLDVMQCISQSVDISQDL